MRGRQGAALPRRRVAALLEAHDEPSRFWESRGASVGDPEDKYLENRHRELPGASIGPYRLIEQIGEGGFGVVYLAEQSHPVRRRVALKILKPGMDTRQVVARFEAERQALALMDHPHIAQVFDGGEAPSGRPYFVMELVAGEPITAFCDRRRLSTHRRLELFASVCRAVQHAHQKGVIHRDLKPSNVLVEERDGLPSAKVIDFGVAKALGGELTEKTVFTELAQVIGTPLYMSPEQADRGGLDVDTRSDVYSLGVMLYELLTGSTPFEVERFRRAPFDEIRRILREEEPPRPSARLGQLKDSLRQVATQRGADPARLQKELRGELDWIAMKSLEKDRGRRYESASNLAADIERYLVDEPVLACPPSLAYRLRKLARRNRGAFLAVSSIAVALVVGMIGTTLGLLRANEARAIAVEEAREKDAALLAMQASERDAKEKLWLSLYERARSGRLSQRRGQRLESLRALEQAARLRPDARLRDEATAAMALVDLRRAPGWRSFRPPMAAAYGAQYDLYARLDEPHAISVRTIPNDREIGRIACGEILGSYLYFSPDDRFLLALERDYALRVWRVADGQRAIGADLAGCRAHAFSPDGRLLVVAQNEAAICFELASGGELSRWPIHSTAHTMAFHPDGQRLLVGYLNADVASIYHVPSRKLLGNLPVGRLSNQVVAWRPQGDQAAIVGADPRIQIWNATPPRKVATLEGHQQFVETLTFHPNGELLASHSWDGSLRLWDPATGRVLLQTPLRAGVRPRFSRDGRCLAVEFRGESAERLEVVPSLEYRTLATSAGQGARNYYMADFSHDGRLLAVGMDRGARLWDLEKGSEVASFSGVMPMVFFDGPDLLTGGVDGLQRWPLASVDANEQRLQLGPPRLLSPLKRAWFARADDGRTATAVTDEMRVNRLIDSRTGEVRTEFGEHPFGDVRALSADGRWAASSGWHSDRVRLWDATSGKMIDEWTSGPQTAVYFTPDSKELIVSRADEFSFIDLVSRKPTRRLTRDIAQYPGHVAFSRDGKMMALELTPATIELRESATHRTIARLADPHGDSASWLEFSPAGDRLAVVAKSSNAIHVWDLQAVRQGLKKLRLDWSWRDFEPRRKPVGPSSAIAVEILAADAPTALAIRRQRAIEAIGQYRRELEANSDSAILCNALAWSLLTAPADLRDADAALPLAEKATRLDPKNASFQNTLGLAFFRAGRHAEAANLLLRSIESADERFLAHDLLFLAMSEHCLGKTDSARRRYEQAVLWLAGNLDLTRSQLEELAEFRTEAEALLGIASIDE